jgi:hypothetical protein
MRRFWRHREKAPPAHFAFRWLFPAVLVVLAILTAQLAMEAKTVVLRSRAGAVSRVQTDPTAPGFEAQVAPTPTLLMVQTSDQAQKNELVGAALVSTPSSESGGTMLMFPSDLLFKKVTGESVSIAQLYGEVGIEGLRQYLARLFDADIKSSIVLGATALEELMRPVAPLQYTLRDNVRAVQNGVTVTVLKAGPVSISTAEQVRAATELLGPGEANVNRTARQRAFFQAWFDALPPPSGGTGLPDTEAPFVRFLTRLGQGQAQTRIIEAPFTEVIFRGAVLLTPDMAQLSSVVREMIPFPQAYEPGARLLIEVRNGVGALDKNDPMMRRVVNADGQVVVLGNANAFGVVQSTVVYYRPELLDRIETFAKAIGVSTVQFVDRPGSVIDATVTIGADFTP